MVQVVTGFINGTKHEIEFDDDVDEQTLTRATSEFFAGMELGNLRDSEADLFTPAVEHTLTWEGGYADDPRDPGGRTKFGISAKAFPDLDIAALSVDDAKDIYRSVYWEQPGFDMIPFDTLAAKVFDTGVNIGTRGAGKLLQRAVNDVRAATQGEDVELLQVDGVVGAKTLAAVARLDQGALIDRFIERQMKRYADLVDRNPKLARFLRGWTRRAKSLPPVEAV